jgi:hypothetical protein
MMRVTVLFVTVPGVIVGDAAHRWLLTILI